MADQASPAVANAPTADAAAELAKVTASASQHYAQKKYDAAADFYSQALALQEEINGEMNPANADLLYAYGKCLFQLGVSKSDVLGGKVAGDASQNDKTGKKRKRAPQASAPGPSNTAKDDAIAEAVVEKAVESKEGVKPQDSNNKDKPFFQISGDGEDWEDDSDDAEENDEAGEEDEDDLATAYEILDVARVLFERRIADAEDDARQSKEILADVHDLQAEISLENERFHDAIHDSRASLELKRQLYSPEKGIVAEAHFKLSLALEFASVTVQAGVGDKASKEAEQSQVDQGLRDEAADQMDLAIASTKERKQKLEQAMKDGSSQATSKDVKEIGEIISEMEQRVSLPRCARLLIVN